VDHLECCKWSLATAFAAQYRDKWLGKRVDPEAIFSRAGGVLLLTCASSTKPHTSMPLSDHRESLQVNGVTGSMTGQCH
jgi:hypothetical protein